MFDARHGEFYLVECWVFWDFYKCSWSLFWNKIVTWKHFNPFELYFYDVSQSRTMPCLGLMIPQYWSKTILNFLTSASWSKSFSSLPGENKRYSWSVIFFRHELINNILLNTQMESLHRSLELSVSLQLSPPHPPLLSANSSCLGLHRLLAS